MPPNRKASNSKSETTTTTITTTTTADASGGDGTPDAAPPLIRSTMADDDNESGSANDSTIGAREIATGYTRVKHTVYDGALQMPRTVVENVMAVVEQEAAQTMGGNGIRPLDTYHLPGLDSVQRPCLDPAVKKLKVTELAVKKVQVSKPAPTPTNPLAALYHQPRDIIVTVLQSGVANKTVERRPKMAMTTTTTTTVVTSEMTAKAVSEPERIRGGGGDEEQTKEGPTINSKVEAPKDEVPKDEATKEAVDAASAAHQNTMNPGGAEKKEDVTVMDVDTPEEKQTGSNREVASEQPVERAHKPESEVPSTDNKDLIQMPDKAPPIALPSAEQIDPPFEGQTTVTGTVPVTTTTTPQEPTGEQPVPMDVEEAKPNAAMTADTETPPTGTTTVAAGTETPPTATPAVAATATPQAEIGENPTTVPAPLVATTENTAITVTAPAATSDPSTAAPAPVSSEALNAPPSAEQPIPIAAAPTATTLAAPVVVVAAGGAEGTKSTEAPTKEKNVPATTASSVTATSAIKDEAKETRDEKAEEATKDEVPPAQVLPTKFGPQWEQMKPESSDDSLTPKGELPPRPDWYDKASISAIERLALPEWFNSSAPHRTPEKYLEAREKVIKMSDTLANRNLTNAMIRRAVVGDAGSLHRLRRFLVNWGLINEDAMNDSAPVPASLRAGSQATPKKRFDERLQGNLIEAVVQQSKRRKLDDGSIASSSSTFIPIDWEEVAEAVGHGASPEDCQRNFMLAPLKEAAASARSETSTERPITPDASLEPGSKKGEDAASFKSKKEIQQEFIQELVETTDPHVLQKVLGAAMEATGGNLAESQSATLLGLQLPQFVAEARGHEINLAARLSKLVDLRMQKLENRMSMMDDVEGILEAEKVALELERRDLYTARCRHWFGGA